MAIGSAPLMFIILLMVIFRLPEGRHRPEHGGHLISLGRQHADILLGYLLLLRRGVEDTGEVLRSDIGTLSVGLGEVVGFEEGLYHLFIGGLRRIEENFGRLQVSGLFLTDLLIGGVLHMTAHKSYSGCLYPLGLHEKVFGSPEAARRKVALSQIGTVCK